MLLYVYIPYKTTYEIQTLKLLEGMHLKSPRQKLH